MTPDWLLLHRYAKDNSQEAFASLTARYLNLVYSVCLREVHDPDLAQDVTQAVFLLLARTAPSFRSKNALPGWLFRTARFAAQNARTREQRRKYYEKAAEAMSPPEAAENIIWSEIEPLLNQSLAALREGERDCVLLRFFQGQSFAEVGASLGLSEEAARKRVTRSLEKMRQFFTKNGVIVPAIALPVLLTAHAAKAVPVACQGSVAHLSAIVLAGHTTAALTSSHAYQISQGTIHAMRIAQLKAAVVITILLALGTTTTYGIVRSAASAGKKVSLIKTAQDLVVPSVNSVRETLPKLTSDQKTIYRTVILMGKVRYETGKPAGGVHIGAQLQLIAEGPLLDHETQSGVPTERLKQLMWNETITRPDGSYKLAVGAGIPYNIEIFPVASGQNSPDDNGWVAAAAAGLSGYKNQLVTVPELVLTRGIFVTGTVTDKITGKPIRNVAIGGFGAARPETSSAPAWAHTDTMGHYRMRVIQGSNSLYIADNRYNGLGDDEAKAKGLMKIITASTGHSTEVNFQITPK